MSTESVDAEYLIYLLLWCVGPIVLFFMHSRGRRMPGVLVYSYFLGIFMAHWLGAAVHASPWSQFTSSADTIAGFRVSSYGVLAFIVGTLLVPAQVVSRRGLLGSSGAGSILVPDRIAMILVGIGATAHLLGSTPVASLPSAGAVLSAGRQCILLGVSLLCWNAWHKGQYRRFYHSVGFAFMLPVMTVVLHGFIGYGVVMLGSILLFIAMFYRPRWLLLLGLVIGIYSGMSFWVAYANNRNEMRDKVWGGEGVEAALQVGQKMFDSLTFFDFSNQSHLALIDIRLNQNWLVGRALVVTPQYVPFQDGRTIIEAIYAVVPRLLWPDKPEVGGSGEYVSEHTMIPFAKGTSVGLGQVFEFYINFGIPGVIGGFLLLGMMLRYFDIRFTDSLASGDARGMITYYVVGASALQPGGSLSEMFAAVASAIVVVWILVRYLDLRNDPSSDGAFKNGTASAGRFGVGS
jgi:hypothetical protein